jgi:hypothetical protein
VPDLAITSTISRTELALPALSLNDHTTYTLIGIGPGAVTWKRQYASSVFVHGDVLVNAVKGHGNLPMMVRVKGTTQAAVDTNLAALLRALDQFSYQLSITIAGVTWTWNCDLADYSVDDGGEFSKFYKLAKQTIVTAQIPRNPIPVAGSV